MTTICIRALGPLCITVDGRTLTRREWHGRVALELFLFLLHHPAGVYRERLVELLWPDKPRAHAAKRLYNAAHRLRCLLPGVLEPADHGYYALAEPAAIEYDVREFMQAIQSARESRHDAPRLAYYRRAVALWRGEFLPECYADWCVEIRDQVHRAYAAALLQLARAAESSDPQAAAQYYHDTLAVDRDREEAYRGLMGAQAALGDRTGAIWTFRELVRVLAELDVPSPDRDTLALYEQIVKGG